MFFPRLFQTDSHSAVLVPAAALCLCLLGWSRGADEARARDLSLGFGHGNHARTATMVVPDGTPPSAGWPAVLVLHGAGESGEQAARGDGWREIARREHFVVIAPDGTPANESRPASVVDSRRVWNSGIGILTGLAASGTSAVSNGVNDVEYLVALLDTATQRVRIDPKRVYVAGHFNGADMSYRIAAEHPERFAAVGVMAGHLIADVPHSLSSAVSLLQIVGDRDPLHPNAIGSLRIGTGGNNTVRAALAATETMWAFFATHQKR